MEEQNRFAQKDLVEIDGKRTMVPFTNIYDKGYRAKMVAWREGNQLVLQPVFAKSDRRFTRDETLQSGSVASDRGGNERGVNVSSSPKLMNDAWMTWAFQSNFMFAPVQ